MYKKLALLSLITIATLSLLDSQSPNLIASQPTFFRIATGGTAGTYFPLGGVIANAISQSHQCQDKENCGVPGLTAIAQTSNGSVANINAIHAKSVESGFVQADVVHWAYTGTGLFAKRGKIEDIRIIAALYPETVHLVVRKGSGIDSVHGLKGKRVSLDEIGSGTLVDAQLIMESAGLSKRDFTPEYIKPSGAKIKDNHLDAFFIVAGYPTGSVVELTASGAGSLVPIAGKGIDDLVKQYPFFQSATIPASTYKGVPDTPTISVMALWVVHKDVDENLVYAITKALWSKHSRKLLDNGHAKGKQITQANALKSQVVPLHSGAARFYREVGMQSNS
ncbi:MAG: TAXI family TRAP transporter solute-binding subunit [Pseudomonadota bacterium]